MTSPRPARLSAALAALAAVAVVVVVLPGRPTALAAPGGNYGPVDYLTPLLGDRKRKSDYVNHRPASHESTSYSLLPDYSLPPHYSLLPDGRDMISIIMNNVDLAEMAMIEAAQSIAGDKPDSGMSGRFFKITYGSFFKPRLSRLLQKAEKSDPWYPLNRLWYPEDYDRPPYFDEEDVRVQYGEFPGNFQRQTVAKWIVSFARNRCSASKSQILQAAKKWIEDPDEIRRVWRDDPDRISVAWRASVWKLARLEVLVSEIKDMADDFVEQLQPNEKSTEQKQSVMYTEYESHYDAMIGPNRISGDSLLVTPLSPEHSVAPEQFFVDVLVEPEPAVRFDL